MTCVKVELYFFSSYLMSDSSLARDRIERFFNVILATVDYEYIMVALNREHCSMSRRVREAKDMHTLNSHAYVWHVRVPADKSRASTSPSRIARTPAFYSAIIRSITVPICITASMREYDELLTKSIFERQPLLFLPPRLISLRNKLRPAEVKK